MRQGEASAGAVLETRKDRLVERAARRAGADAIRDDLRLWSAELVWWWGAIRRGVCGDISRGSVVS